MTQPRVGFVGVGNMGAAMAKRVLASGLPLTVADAHAAACEALRAEGAAVAATPREVAAASDVVCVVVLDDAQVREVVCGDDGLLSADDGAKLVVIHSTVHAETVHEVAARADAQGVGVVDAGVTGSVQAAEANDLAIMVGGDPDTIARCQPVLECYGGLIRRMGALGSGMHAKAARNAITFVQATAVFEGMRLAERAGIDLKALAEIVRRSDRYSVPSDALWGRATTEPADDTTEAGRGWLQIGQYVSKIAEKDLGAALTLAGRLGVELPATQAARDHVAEVWGLAPISRRGT